MRIWWGWVVVAAAAVASAQVLETKTYKTSGHPTEALETPDGKYVLVTVDGNGQSGLDVFAVDAEGLKRVAFQPLGMGNQQGAQGIVLIPGTHVLAVGMSSLGVGFLSLDDAVMGKAKVKLLSQGQGSGTGYLAVTPDGQYLFAANEYGMGGNVGVIALHQDADGVHPELVAQIATPNTTPGVTISADGSRVYAVGEVMERGVTAKLPGHGVKELEREGCRQGGPQAMPGGVLYAIDVARVRRLTKESTRDEVRATVVGMEDAGCSPVREAVEGGLVYVTARGDDRVLVFDAKKMETDREHAFVRAMDSGGKAPVGLKVFGGGKMLLVANSNRFGVGSGNAAVIDVSEPETPVVRQTIRTGDFPRNVTASGDGERLYVTVFLEDRMMVLRGR